MAIGTPGYMASEQHRGDPRFNSDIYALGMAGIQAITGFYPDRLPRDRAFDCSEELARILSKMVRNDFLQRYKSANTETMPQRMHF